MENKDLSPVVKDALKKVMSISKMDKSGLVKTYDEWSNYDESMIVLCYSGPEHTVAGVVEHLPGRRDVSILDVGAGTGAVASELRKQGFTSIDALEPSEEMLKVAEKKHIYQKYFLAPFNDNVECIETSSYDVLVCSGSISCLPVKALHEMIRCVKTGGLVVLVFNERCLTKVPNLMPTIEELQAQDKWHCLEKIIFPGYIVNENGMRIVLKITKSI